MPACAEPPKGLQKAIMKGSSAHRLQETVEAEGTRMTLLLHKGCCIAPFTPVSVKLTTLSTHRLINSPRAPHSFNVAAGFGQERAEL